MQLFNLQNDFVKKHNYPVFFYCLLMIPIFFSCKKTVDLKPEPYSSETTSESKRKSTLSTSDIANWLVTSKSANTPNKNSFIDSIILNSDFSRMHSENFGGFENLIVVPLKENYFSRHVKGRKPLQYLILVEGNKGEIRRCNLVLFYPTNIAIKSLPNNALRDFFKSTRFPVDGTFSLVSLNDANVFEFDIKNGVK